MNDDRDVLITLRVRVVSLEGLLEKMETRVGKVENKLDEKYDIIIERVEDVRSNNLKKDIAFWKLLATFFISSGLSFLGEYIITHH